MIWRPFMGPQGATFCNCCGKRMHEQTAGATGFVPESRKPGQDIFLIPKGISPPKRHRSAPHFPRALPPRSRLGALSRASFFGQSAKANAPLQIRDDSAEVNANDRQHGRP
jgi:hypothetical protein